MSSSHSSPHRWSARLAQRYACVLSDDLADWFDREVWKACGSGEYHEAVHPETLLADAPDPIWPGLMPPNVLPILGDSMGNWLCVRIDAENTASEIVQWFHGGGDWIPWGSRISEAIVFETLVPRLPGPKRRAALPAETFQRNSSAKNDPVVMWAFEYQPSEVTRLLNESAEPGTVAEVLLDHAIAEVAVRFELIQAALFLPWSGNVNRAIADSLGLAWNDVVEWMFDAARMPESGWQQLSTLINIGKFNQSSSRQDWETVAVHAQKCQKLAPDLSWPWDLMGYYHERCGKPSDAIQAYRQGAIQSTFTDQAVRLHMHWTQPSAAKFSVARLRELDLALVNEHDYFKLLIKTRSANDPLPLHQVYEYWLGAARKNQVNGNVTESLNHLVRAGWDLGSEKISNYGPLLERIEKTASAAGQSGRANLAKIHRQCLKHRYGI